MSTLQVLQYRQRIGGRLRRTEDHELVTGRARYVADLRVHQLHAAFVRSSHAHAHLRSIDTREAATAAGVVGVYAAADLALTPLLGHHMLDRALDRPPLAEERVRFVGDPIAVVVAETAAAAVDAAELVVVDYDALPAVVEPQAALLPEAPQLVPGREDNEAYVFAVGDDEDPLAGADLVVRVRAVNQRVAPAPMEPDGTLAVPDDDGGVTVWASTQRVHFVRDRIAEVLELPAERVRVVIPRVGGGFGAKYEAAAETVVTAAVARRLGRPVAWTQTRHESMLVLPHGRGQVQHGALGLQRNGTFVGLDLELLGDAGAYPITGALIPRATLLMAPGPYRIPRVRGRARTAVTNTTPVGAYRGAGRPEATALLERLVETAARRLGVDPVELRRQNLITSGEYPYRSATGAMYDSGDLTGCLDSVAVRIDLAGVREEQARRRADGAERVLGIALCPWMDHTPMNRPGEYVSLRLHVSEGAARFDVAAGTCDHGQAHQTTWAMVLSDRLGIPVEAVCLLPADTTLVPHGEGTGSARSLQLVGNGLRRAADDLLVSARSVAATLLDVEVDRVLLTEGGELAVDGLGPGVTWSDVARAAGPDGLQVEVDYEQSGPTFPGGVHGAVVEVDTATGRVELQRFVAVDDCGRVINPVVVEGQQHGGIAQGVAQALYEQVVHDATGTPMTTTFVDYTLPAAPDLPAFEVATTDRPSPVNDLGAKGIGQGGAIGAAAAVQNAVMDALAHLGVEHVDMPCTPQRVWRAITDERTSNHIKY